MYVIWPLPRHFGKMMFPVEKVGCMIFNVSVLEGWFWMSIQQETYCCFFTYLLHTVGLYWLRFGAQTSQFALEKKQIQQTNL